MDKKEDMRQYIIGPHPDRSQLVVYKTIQAAIDANVVYIVVEADSAKQAKEIAKEILLQQYNTEEL